MRIAKIPAEIVEAKVLESLRSRMDPATRRVYPRWKLMMREIAPVLYVTTFPWYGTNFMDAASGVHGASATLSLMYFM